MTKKISVFLLSLIVSLALPVTCFAANIQWAVGEDDGDCDHDYQITAYSDDNNTLTLTCSKCGDVVTDKLDDLMADMLVDDAAVSDEVQASCDHHYVCISFDSENATGVICCTSCGAYFTDDFVTHLNAKEGDSNYVTWFDVVPGDKIINGKDYAKLLHTLTDVGKSDTTGLVEVLSDSTFHYKEIFFYTYFTVLIVALTCILCFVARRRSV